MDKNKISITRNLAMFGARDHLVLGISGNLTGKERIIVLTFFSSGGVNIKKEAKLF